ncbi:MAG: Acetyltransferase (GNAT) family protein [Candidatus Izimaplasma bacterium HR2]|nr:MAG: Acetyltransferase (GNAT) family protein [Candidatus Izimaplasma bacterium HR2]
MVEVTMVNNMEEFLEYNQIINLCLDQMEHIGSPKTNIQIMDVFKLAFSSKMSKLMVISEMSNPIGFAFFNVSIGMESLGKYIWLNEMHIHSKYRGEGYGSILFEGIRNWCKDNEIHRIMGMIEETEERTLSFYKKQGCDIYQEKVFSTYDI